MLLLAVIAFASCHDDTPEEKPEAKFVQTVIMYLPWSGSDMITPFHNNIDGMERVLVLAQVAGLQVLAAALPACHPECLLRRFCHHEMLLPA